MNLLDGMAGRYVSHSPMKKACLADGRMEVRSEFERSTSRLFSILGIE